MSDQFAGRPRAPSEPAYGHFEITPSDSVDLTHVPSAIRVGGAGDVVIRDRHDVDITYTCTAGEILGVRAVRVLATGTTATNLVAWF